MDLSIELTLCRSQGQSSVKTRPLTLSRRRRRLGRGLCLLLPSLVHILAAKDLPLLQCHHVAPLGLVDGIHETAGLHTESGALAVRWGTLNPRHIDILASVELEGRLGAVHLEVQPGAGVAELGQPAYWQAARVEGDLARVGLHDEDVVNVRLGRVQHERLGDLARELVDCAMWDPRGVEGQVVGSGQLGGGASHVGAVADVEVAGKDDIQYGMTDRTDTKRQMEKLTCGW